MRLRPARRLPALALPVLFLAATVALTACETGIESGPDAELSLQTKNALDVLPADVRAVGMANMQALKENASLPSFGDVNLEELQGEEGARARAFLEATGFDPERDLREVYFAVEGDGSDARPSMVAYATFDRSRIESYVDEQMGDAFTETTYNGVTVYVAREGDDEGAFAFVNDAMILASPVVEQVHAMIDRVQSGGRALRDDAEMIDLLEAVGDGDAWLVTREVPSAGAPDGMRLDRAIGRFAFTLDATADGLSGRAVMTPAAGVASSDLVDLTKGMVAAARTGASEAAQTRFLDDVEVEAVGEQVRVRFHADNELLAQIQH